TVRIGALPWYQSEPLPTGRELFAAYGLLLAANQAARAERWAEAARLYKGLLDSPLMLNELFTVSYMYQMLLGMGAAFDNLGAEEAASEAWLLAAETEPQEAEPYFQLGKLLAERGQYEESVKYYLMAEEREPDDMVLLYNLGAGLLQLGRHGEAAARFERAAALDPSVENLLSLTVAYGRSGQRERAQTAFARARAMAPDHPQVAAIARMLAGQR
ncbi:tetratricopeptide repeat protein, partial [bacterium]|nr:tetratricopeptide repeat protein [bacterium]